MPSDDASLKPSRAAISVDDDVAFIAGSAKPPVRAASSISLYLSGVAIGTRFLHVPMGKPRR